MSGASSVDNASGSEGRISRTQWRALMAAWLGWAFDGLDGYLYIMVAGPFVTQLVANEHGLTAAQVAADPARLGEVTNRAAIIQAVFLVGWAVGGAVFGRIGDRLGRSRTLMLTILTYAVFTGLSFFAERWWHLMIFRFLAALGIGGEWAAGCALVSETLHKRHRSWASATLQSGYMVGCIMAALTSRWMAELPPRWVFVVGVMPALATFWIRRAVPEPEEWAKAAEQAKPPPLGSLFSRELWKTTVLTTTLTSIALTTVWAFLFFAPQAIRAIPEVAGWTRAEQTRLVTDITIYFLIINIVGNYFATYFAKFVGYRAAFAAMFAASLACYLVFFRTELTITGAYAATGLCAFFSLGVFGLFPLYIPRLYPTLVRTLGAGFTYNAGRLVSAAGAYFGGLIAVGAGGPHKAIFWTGLLFIPGIVVALLCAVPREDGAEARADEEFGG